jgi:hypothetical protein
MFPLRFNQKTTKEDLFVKWNRVILQDKRGKTLEDSRSFFTDAEPKPLPGGAGRSHMQAD